MKKFWNLLIRISLSLLIIIILDYNFGEHYNKALDKILNFYQPVLNKINPCSQLINYSIGEFDDRFNLTKEDFLTNLEIAEKIWEQPMKRNLFNHAENGNMKINLVYDYRQEATDRLKKLGIVIDNNQDSYDKLKASYDSLVKEYGVKTSELSELTKDYQVKKDAYEKKVSFWNKEKNITPKERQKIESERIALNSQGELTNKKQAELKDLIDEANDTANIINRLINELNLGVDAYNTIGGVVGKEFQEGEYVRDANGEKITIYQFDNQNKLIRVLAHELGHALGLEHNDNPDSIMYALNEGKNEKLSAEDINDMRSLCGIE